MSRGVTLTVATVALLLAACSSTSAEEAATQQHLAVDLVSATQEAGILPRLTPDVVASLYGSDASSVCDAFDGGLSTSGANLLRGNPGHARRNNITTTAVIYAGLVIQTYCPDVLADFEFEIADIDPIKLNR